MASKRQRGTARNTYNGSNAMGIQKQINQDYVDLGRDYKKLFIEIWRIPATKYVLGGAAVAALIPFAMKAFGEDSQVTTYIRGVFNKADDTFDSLNE